MKNYLGVDFGTTAIKALILSEDGGVLCSHYDRRAALIVEAEFHPDHPINVWPAFKQVLQVLREKNADAYQHIRHVGISGVVPNVCLIDATGAVHEPLLRYSDRRAYDIELELDRTLNNGEWQNEVLSKLIWFKLHQPPQPGIKAKIFSPHAWLTYHLSGEYVLDRVSAIEHGAVYAKNTQAWDRELLERFGIDFLEWPKLASPFDTLGSLRPSVAAELHLTGPVSISAGAPDFLASVIGSGARRQGDTMIYLGTYHCGLELTSSLTDIRSGNAVGQPFRWVATIPQAGPQCESAAELVSGLKGKEAWQAVEKMAGAVHSATSDAGFVPCIQLKTSTISTEPTAAFFFNNRRASQGNLAQSILTGTACGIAYDIAARGYSLEGRAVFISGGACRSPLQREILARILGCPLNYIPAAEDGLGSALLALGSDDWQRFQTINPVSCWGATEVVPTVRTDADRAAMDFYSRVVSAEWNPVGPTR